MEINPFTHNETRLLVINNEIVQITFKLHNESDNSLYTENNVLQDEIKQIIIAFVKFMDEDHIVDGEGYYLLCKKCIWNFGKNYVFYRNDKVIQPHQYKYNFELEFANQVINGNASYDRGRNKSITDSNKIFSREFSFDDNFGTPKSSNNVINQEIIQRVTARATHDTRQGVMATGFNSPFNNGQTISRFAESAHTTLWTAADNAYMTPFDNQRQMQKPVDSAYATLFNYRAPMQRTINNAYATPIDNRDRMQKFATENREYPESTQHRNLFGYQDNVSGTSRNPILLGETFEQISRTSSIGISQESFMGGNWPGHNSLETTLSLDSGSQKVSGISKSQFQTQTRQISNISYSTDNNNAFSDGDDEPSMQNAAGSESDNTRDTNNNSVNNSFFSPLNFIRRMWNI